MRYTVQNRFLIYFLYALIVLLIVAVGLIYNTQKNQDVTIHKLQETIQKIVSENT